MDTEIGRHRRRCSPAQKQELTPLQKRLADLGKILGVVAVVVCLAMFGIAVLQRRDIPEMLLTAISLAVAAIPEGLPAVVTIVLALGVQRMVKVNTIVRRLPSVETLGAAQRRLLGQDRHPDPEPHDGHHGLAGRYDCAA